MSYEQLGYEPPPAPPDVPWNLPTNKKPVWLRDERDDHQKPASLCGRITASRRAATARCGRCARCPPGCGSVKRRAARRRRRRLAVAPVAAAARHRHRAATAASDASVRLLRTSRRPPRAAEGASRPAARLRRPAAAALAAKAALTAAHIRRAHADLLRWQRRRFVPPGGDAARPRTRRAMGPRHTRGRSGERAEREREPEGFR